MSGRLVGRDSFVKCLFSDPSGTFVGFLWPGQYRKENSMLSDEFLVITEGPRIFVEVWMIGVKADDIQMKSNNDW